MSEILFPFDKPRQGQTQLMMDIYNAVSSGEHLLVHAPTGLGKTIGAMAPVLTYAIEHEKKVFFLTSRHTQHKLAIESVRMIEEKFDKEISVSSFIGKKWMCAVQGVENLYAGEFADYCKKQKEKNMCPYYERLRNGTRLSDETKKCLQHIKEKQVYDVEQVKELAISYKICPYEVSLLQAKSAQVIIADYNYVFNPSIRHAFFSRLGIEIEDCIVVVDEAHNLPSRVKDFASAKLSTYMLARAQKEASQFEYEKLAEYLSHIREIFEEFSEDMSTYEEKMISRHKLLDALALLDPAYDIEEFIGDLEEVSELVKEEKEHSNLHGVAEFFIAWLGGDEGFFRYISKSKDGKGRAIITISYSCLDAGAVSKDPIALCHSVIAMSGTLNPPDMYRDILGFETKRTKLLVLDNPFPSENKLNMIVPLTTTKYTARGEKQFKDMGRIIGEIVNEVPGNLLVFFPSYMIRDQVRPFIEGSCSKKIMLEDQAFSKQEKETLLHRFKEARNNGGAVLLCVSMGSFGEGIDLMGDLLECVVVVGLPLQKPDLKTKAAIDYFDAKFGRGWDFGYIFPAFTVCLQNAGRLIRSESDRGVLIFLDERYAWPRYARCFPQDWDLKVTTEYLAGIEWFFGK